MSNPPVQPKKDDDVPGYIVISFIGATIIAITVCVVIIPDMGDCTENIYNGCVKVNPIQCESASFFGNKKYYSKYEIQMFYYNKDNELIGLCEQEKEFVGDERCEDVFPNHVISSGSMKILIKKCGSEEQQSKFFECDDNSTPLLPLNSTNTTFDYCSIKA